MIISQYIFRKLGDLSVDEFMSADLSDTESDASARNQDVKRKKAKPLKKEPKG